MQELRGRVAVITGAGSGIGRGMALAFADAGMHVVAADVDGKAARAVADELAERGVRSLAHEVDVSDRAAMGALADRVYTELGAVHVLCNNAGIATGGPVQEMADDDWGWVLAVNLHGVVHGLQAFVPRMQAQQGEAHIVNTASMAGLVAYPGLTAYTTTKFAVVGLSESIRQDLEPFGIGVSVLCPGLVSTRIFDSGRNRPRRFGGPKPLAEGAGQALRERGIDPLEVGRAVCEAVRRNEPYIFTHPQARASVAERFDAVLRAFDAAAERSSG
jgi:NAD(P)-dependent dehydrogenase (short-subunit alcohol dehydrogenase family)